MSDGTDVVRFRVTRDDQNQNPCKGIFGSDFEMINTTFSHSCFK